MKLTKQAILEYQEVHLNEFGEKISYSEAEQCASKLLTLFQYLFNKESYVQNSEIHKKNP